MKNFRKLLLLFLLISVLIPSFSCKKAHREVSRNLNRQNYDDFVYFKDDAENVVRVKKNITRVAVSGRISQSIVFAIAPDSLCAVAEDWSSYEKSVIDKKYTSLPILGRIYGGTNVLNKEALLSLSPDVVIDIGQKQENIKETLEALTSETGIPFVHLTLTSTNLKDVYEKLGILLNKQNEASEIISFIKDTERYRDEVFSKTEKKSAIFITGKNATRVLQKGSYFSSSLDMCTDNKADFPTLNKNKYAFTINKEDLLKLKSDVIIFSSIVDEGEIYKNGAITSLDAFKNGSYYFFPHIPYENMGFPPGPSEVFSTLWFLKTLYPAYISFDYEGEIERFYTLFFHKS